MDRRDFSLERVLDLHIARLKQHIELERQLCERLEKIADRLRSADEVSVEEFTRTIGETTMMEGITRRNNWIS